jgi:hypothetical protein
LTPRNARPAEQMHAGLPGNQGGSEAMNHRHRKVLAALFAHPISANIDFKEVVHLLGELGGEVENRSGNRIGVTLNGHTATFMHAHHSLPKEEVVQVRRFLEACGIDPAAYPA